MEAELLDSDGQDHGMAGSEGLIPFSDTEDWPGQFGAARLGIP